MISVIDHTQRAKMGITAVQYLVCDACSKYHAVLRKTSDLHDAIGISKGITTSAINEMKSCSPALLEDHENGSVYPTRWWYEAHLGEVEEVVSKNAELAKNVLQFFNELNKTSYSLKTNTHLVSAILKSNPTLNERHFKAVISHKHETWGVDEKMKEYNRPSTLFSSKFMRYLDEAIIYYSNKQK